ncbi:hypothetical protein ABIE67_000479 [Streptomyces sp. V4I8]|uniref:terpene synthase family protein n=1 Tax=Streptomyces sp. V4I8 TaxID=3156469 RepID=UPI00351415BA
MTEPFVRPMFYMPFASGGVHPHCDMAREHTKVWARTMGLFDPEYEELSDGAWSEARCIAADIPKFAAMTTPDVAPAELELGADWHTATWFFDDVFLPGCLKSGDRADTRARLDRLLAFMPVRPQMPPLLPNNALERCLTDLWARSAWRMSEDWRRRITGAWRTYFAGSLWEVDNLQRERHPDYIDYFQMRRDFGAAGIAAALLEMACGTEIRQDVYDSQPFQALFQAYRDLADLNNDVVSYAKDEASGETANNAVNALQRQLGCSLQQAADLTNDLMTSRVHTLQTAADEDLPALLHERGTSRHEQQQIARYIRALQTWLAGSYDWHETTARYGAPAAGLHLPTGLGTSAARCLQNLHLSGARR